MCQKKCQSKRLHILKCLVFLARVLRANLQHSLWYRLVVWSGSFEVRCQLLFSRQALGRDSYSCLRYQSLGQPPIFSVEWESHRRLWVDFLYLASQIPTDYLYQSIYSEEIFLRSCKESSCYCARFGWICSQSKFATFLAYQEKIEFKLLFQLGELW